MSDFKEIGITYQPRNVDMNTLVSMFNVPCHHLSGKYMIWK